MGKKTGIACLGIGAFVLVVAGMAKFWAYDELAVAPLDQDTTTVSYGADATYLDVETPEGTTIVEGGELVSTRRVAGQVDLAEEAGDDIAVYDSYKYNNPADDVDNVESPLSGIYDRVAFDRHTGEAVDTDAVETFSESDGTRSETTFEGQYFKLPFNTQKQDYQFWDDSLRQATPMRYDGEDEIDGLPVYRFVQTIEPTKIAEVEVPGSLLGGAETSPGVLADRMYANVRTIWVEPETGVIIKGQEEQHTTLDVNGVERATIIDVTIAYDDETVANNIDEYETQAILLGLIRFWIPVGGAVLGGLLVVGGLVLLLRALRREPVGQPGARRADHAVAG